MGQHTFQGTLGRFLELLTEYETANKINRVDIPAVVKLGLYQQARSDTDAPAVYCASCEAECTPLELNEHGVCETCTDKGFF